MKKYRVTQEVMNELKAYRSGLDYTETVQEVLTDIMDGNPVLNDWVYGGGIDYEKTIKRELTVITYFFNEADNFEAVEE